MSATTNYRYGHMALGMSTRAHVDTAVWTAIHVPAGVKQSFIEDATTHRRSPEVLLT